MELEPGRELAAFRNPLREDRGMRLIVERDGLDEKGRERGDTFPERGSSAALFQRRERIRREVRANLLRILRLHGDDEIEDDAAQECVRAGRLVPLRDVPVRIVRDEGRYWDDRRKLRRSRRLIRRGACAPAGTEEGAEEDRREERGSAHGVHWAMFPRSMPRTPSERSWIAPAAALAVFVLLALATVAVLARDLGSLRPSSALPSTEAPGTEERGIVVRVVDGDTIHVALPTETVIVRIVWIYTQERGTNPPECYSLEATEELARLADDAEVRLTRDARTDDRDRYGRLLRIVTVDGQSRSVNEELVARGAAEAYQKYPAALMPVLVELESDAKEAKAGMWGECGD